MHSYFVAGMADAHEAAGDLHRHRLTNQAPRHVVGVRIDLHARIIVHAPEQSPDLQEWRLRRMRAMRCPFMLDEASQSLFARGIVYMDIGHLSHPPSQMSFQGFPALKAMRSA